MTGPYASAAETYWRAGWRGILPLPPRAKKNPPAGYTGAGGGFPSYPDLYTWTEGKEGAGNIALRLPENVIGIDVDAYGDKPGEATLRLAEAMHGELPPTWRTTSRDDGISGIRLYRVPEGLAWPGEIGPATELIQTRHRYAIVAPSIHPEGGTYRWIRPDGVVSTTVPDPDELPVLPDAWVEAYTRGESATETVRMQIGHSDALAWVVTEPLATAAPCSRMTKVADQFEVDLVGSCHNAGRDAALRIVRLSNEGHAGAVAALADVRRGFLAEATRADRTLLGKARRTAPEAEYEWNELVASAVGIVAANPTGILSCDCYGQLTEAIVTKQPTSLPTSGVDGATALAASPNPSTEPTRLETAPSESDRFITGGTFVLDAPDYVPSIWGDGDECLWAEGEALMIVGPPGVGKTTITGQVVRGLLGLEFHVLGLTVKPTHGRVLYLAMDRPKQIARSLRRVFEPTDRDLLDDRLRVWGGPPPGDVAKHPDVLLALATLAGASVVVVDSVKDAAVGLTEDEVAAGYNRARQHCLANGVEVLELHHMVKRGVGGNKPTELADVYGSAWLTAGAGSVLLIWGAAGDPIVELRHLKQPAAEVGPYKLEHDHAAGTTRIWHSTDLLELLAAAGTRGLSTKAAASALFDTTKPTAAEREKAKRRLNRLVEQGYAIREDVPSETGAGKPTSVYRSNNGRITQGVSEEGSNDPLTRITPTPVSPGQTNNGLNNANNGLGRITAVPPSIEGDGATTPTTADCNRCGRETPIPVLEAMRGLCGKCATS